MKKRKFKKGPQVVSVAEIPEHDWFIVKMGARDKTPKPPMDSDLFISRSRKRLEDLTPEDCDDAECFEYHNQRVWNGF